MNEESMATTAPAGQASPLNMLPKILKREIEEALVRPMVSGASAASVLLLLAHLLREPKFAEVHIELTRHMVSVGVADALFIAPLFAGLSCVLAGWDLRRQIDNWVSTPIIRLLAHIYALAAGVMLSNTVFGIFIVEREVLLKNMLLPAWAFANYAILVVACLCSMILCGPDFVDDHLNRRRVSRITGLMLLVGCYLLVRNG